MTLKTVSWLCSRFERRCGTALTYLVLSAFLLFAVIPIVIIFFASLKDSTELGQGVLRLPESWLWSNYKTAWYQGHFDVYFRNSVIVTAAVVILATLLSILSGYGFGQFRFPLNQVLFFVLLLGMMVPVEVFIIPLYYQMRDLELIDSYWALILPQVSLSVCFGTFWMRSFFVGVPADLVDASHIDGCSSWGTLWRVLLPLARPAILTMVVLFTLWTWNEFLLALVLVSNEELRTLPLGMAFFKGRFASDIPLTSAGAIITALPIMLVYFVFQRQFIRGITAGSSTGQ